jgi:glycosyltransferase involved in cell wall biosynthesis
VGAIRQQRAVRHSHPPLDGWNSRPPGQGMVREVVQDRNCRIQIIGPAMKQRILIVSAIQLSTNPRVVKEADTLAGAGYEVEVLGALVEPALAERDRRLFEGKPWKYTCVFDASSPRRADRLRTFAARGRMRFWREIYARLGISNPRQLGLSVPETLDYCTDHPADLYIVHNPENLWVGAELLQRGSRVAADVEDWYSEDLLPEDRRGYPVEDLRRWEGVVLRGAAYATTTSRVLSHALASAFDCKPPAVVYNTFPWQERAAIDGEVRDRVDRGLRSLCWFSQVVGPGRGLETLMDSLSHVKIPSEIHLRGHLRHDYRSSLVARAPEVWRERIYFHAQVPHAELISRIAEHDVGLALEIPFCRNRALTITNKVPSYLLAGLAVVASDTEGQREVAALADGAVMTYAAGSPTDLASALNRLLANDEHLRAARASALASAETRFCWERSAPVLLEQVRLALDKCLTADTGRKHATA